MDAYTWGSLYVENEVLVIKEPRVLVVEDNQELLERYQGQMAWVCKLVSRPSLVYASSSKEALEIARSDQVHLLITGNHLPEMNGIDLLRRIRRLRPVVRSIMVAGDVTQAAYSVGFDRVFPPSSMGFRMEPEMQRCIVGLLDVPTDSLLAST